MAAGVDSTFYDTVLTVAVSGQHDTGRGLSFGVQLNKLSRLLGVECWEAGRTSS